MSYNPIHEHCGPFKPQLVIPTTFEECLSYEQQVNFLAQKLHDLEERVEALEAEVEPNSES